MWAVRSPPATRSYLPHAGQGAVMRRMSADGCGNCYNAMADSSHHHQEWCEPLESVRMPSRRLALSLVFDLDRACQILPSYCRILGRLTFY